MKPLPVFVRNLELQNRSDMEERRNIPALRFLKFEGEWERKKLGDITKISSGGTPSRGNVSYWNGHIPWVTTSLIDFNIIEDSEEYITQNAVSNSSAKLFPKGTILMAMYGQGKTRGKVAILGLDATTNQACAAILENKNCEGLFVYQNLAGRYDEIRGLSNEGGQQNLSGGLIKGIKLALPTLPEQQKIAAFLTTVDDKIAQLTKKKALLEQYKKGVMQRIFKQEIRFKPTSAKASSGKDENGKDFPEWEEKKLGEVCNIQRGASPRPITSPIWFDNKSNVGWVRISDVTKSKKYLNETTQYLSKDGISKSRFIPKGNMIMSICATIGKPIYTNFDVCIHDGFIVFTDLQTDKEYLYYYLDMIQDKWYRYGQPGTQVNLNTSIVSAEKFLVPCLQEQQKIASFLTSIDQKIEQVNTQLEKAKTWKKGLLQKMFV
jgi:type I restriction enzyme S subunit